MDEQLISVPISISKADYDALAVQARAKQIDGLTVEETLVALLIEHQMIHGEYRSGDPPRGILAAQGDY